MTSVERGRCSAHASYSCTVSLLGRKNGCGGRRNDVVKLPTTQQAEQETKAQRKCRYHLLQKSADDRGPAKSRRDRRSKKLVASVIRWTREEAARQGLACVTTPCEWSTSSPHCRRVPADTGREFNFGSRCQPSCSIEGIFPLQEAIDASFCGEQLPSSTLQRPAPTCQPNSTQRSSAASYPKKLTPAVRARRIQHRDMQPPACADPGYAGLSFLNPAQALRTVFRM